MTEVENMDGNAEESNQGEVLDASHSDSLEAATEQAPSATENAAITTKSQEETQKPSIDYQKSYKELERTYQRQQQQLAQLKKDYDSFSPYKDKVSSWAKADEILAKDPQAFRYLQARLQGMSHNEAQSLTEQAESNPHLEALRREVHELKTFREQQEKQAWEAKTASILDKQEALANGVYQKFFGKDMNEQDKNEMYNWMTQNNIYNGEAAVKALYAEKYAEAYAQKILGEQKVKGQKVVQKTGVTNSATAKAPSKSISLRDAIESAYEEATGGQ